MKISIIAAKAKNNAIGKNNKLLWHLPEDLKYFRDKTMGHHVLMGRKTYQSLVEDMKGRKIIVITNNTDFKISDDSMVFNGIAAGIREAHKKNETELFICGGGSIYQQAIEFADSMYLTELNEEFEGDTFFPTFNNADWDIRILNEFEKSDQNPIAFKIVEYKKKL